MKINKKLYIFIILFVILIIGLFFVLLHKEEKIEKKPCSNNLTDREYLEHMIPHHQVAVDMSKVLIKNTKNDFMVYMAYRIIRSQQAEIILLDEFLNKSTYKHHSELIN